MAEPHREGLTCTTISDAAHDPTACELQVLRLIADGLTDQEIARRLGISPATVAYHVGRLHRRLGVPSRPAAVAAAFRRGLID